MGLRDFLSKQRSMATVSATSSSAPSADENPRVTTMEREHFLLQAPFEWVAVLGDNPLEFEFRNQTLREQLIVTVLLARKPLDLGELQRIAMELMEKRLTAVRSISRGCAVHSSPHVKATIGEAEVRCFGHDEAQKVRFAFVVRVTPAKVVTVSLTRYFLEEVGSPFEIYCGIIFDLLRIKTANALAE